MPEIPAESLGWSITGIVAVVVILLVILSRVPDAEIAGLNYLS